jgi:CelD/BcsL family acetyltransferase involved in cellulose biosynthesis
VKSAVATLSGGKDAMQDGFLFRAGEPMSVSRDISIIRDRRGFDALAGEWNDLFDRAAQPEHIFQNHRWLSCWADHYLDQPGRLRIVTGRLNGRLAMVWPLVASVNSCRLTQLGWMGEPVGQYGDALLEPGPQSKEMLSLGWRAVKALGADLILLRKTRRGSNVGELLSREAKICEIAEAPFALFAGKTSFADVLARRSAKAQSSRRRLLRRLQETGSVSFCAGAEGAEAQRLIGAAFAMKREWLLRRGLYSGPIESDAMLSFFLDFVKRPPEGGAAIVDAILRDGAPVSIGVTLSCKGAGLGHLLAHDPECEKQGVGVLLADHVMKSCFERGMTHYDMLAPFDPYKAEWADGAAAVADYVAGFTPQGRLFAYAWRSQARQKLKAALKTMPASVGRVIWPLARKIKNNRMSR